MNTTLEVKQSFVKGQIDAQVKGLIDLYLNLQHSLELAQILRLPKEYEKLHRSITGHVYTLNKFFEGA